MRVNESPKNGLLQLVVKKYMEPQSFTSQLYGNREATLTIKGPLGRGLCLEAIPKG